MMESFENRIINFLIEIPEMNRRETRDLLLSNLPQQPVSLMSRDDASRQDLTCIVRSVIQFGQVAKTDTFAIEILIGNIKPFVEGLDKENQLNALLEEFQNENKTKIRAQNRQAFQVDTEIQIPFVIISMTLDEAKQLKSNLESVTRKSEGESNAFHELIESLKLHGIAEFIEYYGSTREDWKPYTCSTKTIRETIFEIADELNTCHEKQEIALPIIQPQFFSNDCFELDSTKRINTWSELKRRGCVIIVDSVSLFYPFVRNKFLSAEVGSHENVSILTLSPINPCMVEANKILEKLVSAQMEQAFFRFHQHLDKRCEIGIGDLRSIKRWLFSILPETIEILSKQKAQPQNRRILQEVVGSPNRLDRLWRGGDV